MEVTYINGSKKLGNGYTANTMNMGIHNDCQKSDASFILEGIVAHTVWI